MTLQHGHVLKFALRMEAKLAKNRHKGDREAWMKDHPWSLVERILDETVEVQECFATDGAGEMWLVKTPEQTADECADVANFCMMVADRVADAKQGNDGTQRPGSPDWSLAPETPQESHRRHEAAQRPPAQTLLDYHVG